MKPPIFTFLVVIFFATFNLNAQDICQEPLPGFQFFGFRNGHNYYISDYKMTPADAQINTANYFGHLAVINDADENDFIQQHISEMVYIGLNDSDSEGTLVWDNGDDFNFSNFDICGFCNDNADDMDYVMMHPWNGGWSWSSKWSPRKYILEIPCDELGADLSMSISASTTEIEVGEPFEVTITISNNGPSDATMIWMNIWHSDHANFANGMPSMGTFQYDYYTVYKWKIPTLQSGEFAELVLDCVGEPTYYSSYSIGGSIIYMDQIDPDGNNNLVSIGIDKVTGVCPDAISGFTKLGDFADHSYFIYDDVSTPADAQTNAESLGGYLAVINSQAENDFIQQAISDMAYIGLNDFDVENIYEWFTGEPVSFTNFDICGFCNANEEDMDYVMMHPWNGGWSWSSKWSPRKYILEVPCNNYTPPSLGNSLIAIASSEEEKFELKKIFPNPAEEFVHVAIRSEEEKTIQLQIVNIGGQIVQRNEIGLHKGENTVEINISDLVAGMFYLQIPEIKGKKKGLRFVKVRD